MEGKWSMGMKKTNLIRLFQFGKHLGRKNIDDNKDYNGTSKCEGYLELSGASFSPIN